uniref:Gamma-interferon-inducible lysosomal thiol reductase n=1 Tax=Cacopsylla melanoneura TaxID=428564 RepID=A0A8D8SWH8_9HEMI
MRWLLGSSCLVILCNMVLDIAQAQEAPVHVTLYYEALCPDSRYFVTRTLRKALESFPDLNIQYVPFGKASSNGYGGFDCQHGPDECRGNIVQSCALARLEPGKPQHDFVYCAMLYPKQYERCVSKSGLSWVDVDACSQSPEGTEYHRHSEVLTKGNTDGPTFVPSIALNNVFDKSESSAAFNDLQYFLCNNYYSGSPKCGSTGFDGYVFGK